MTFKSLLAAYPRPLRRAASLFFTVGVIATLAAPACSNSSSGANSVQEQTCALNSDCGTNLRCLFGKCSVECMTDADCSGGMCVTSGAVAACQTAAQANTPCNSEADCPSPLACASDFRCRNLCTTSADCNVLGIMGKVCAADGQGVHYCADTTDTTNGTITEAPPTGATGTVVEPGGTSSGHDGGSDGTVTSSGSGGSSGGSGSGSGSSSGGATLCTGGCPNGQQCTDAGTCAVCGGSGQACCSGSTPCGSASLQCSAGVCTCGGPSEVCCAGNMCNTGVSCVNDVCACGGAGQACCPTTGSASACTGSLQCAGVECSCQVACSGTIVERSDGTLWNYYDSSTPTEITTGGSSPFYAKSFSEYYGTSGTSGLACAVDTSGGAWCWGANSYGQLGNGNAPTASATPVQVVTSAGANPTPLTNVSKIAVDGYEGYLACAIDTSTNVWCWGYAYYGVLGNGYTNINEQVASPVLTSAGGSQLTGVSQISVAYDHACALKTDGSVWCWGSNSTGQIGNGGATSTTYDFPVQVQSLYNSGLNVAVAYGLSCALTNDNTVWCWGSDSYGQLGNGISSGTSNVPVQVGTTADGGAPFGGVSAIQVGTYYYSGTVFALKAGSIYWWGEGSSSNVPVPYTEGGFAVTGVQTLCPNGASSATFFDKNGAFHYSGSAATTQITCP